MPVVKWKRPQVETFIKNNIRACFRKYAPKEMCYKMASLGKQKNPKTNRMAEHYRDWETDRKSTRLNSSH